MLLKRSERLRKVNSVNCAGLKGGVTWTFRVGVGLPWVDPVRTALLIAVYSPVVFVPQLIRDRKRGEQW